eukprot:474446-Pleurochrysis_carterae.AAC.2
MAGRAEKVCERAFRICRGGTGTVSAAGRCRGVLHLSAPHMTATTRSHGATSSSQTAPVRRFVSSCHICRVRHQPAHRAFAASVTSGCKGDVR